MSDTPRYQPRRLRRTDEPITFDTTDHSRPADRFLRWPATETEPERPAVDGGPPEPDESVTSADVVHVRDAGGDWTFAS